MTNFKTTAILLYMEQLKDVPLKPDTQMNEKEVDVMNRFFSQPTSPPPPSSTLGSKLKMTAYITILFVLLSNGFTDGLLQGLPYIGGRSAMSMMAIKAIIFFVMMVIIMYTFA
jgi:hypothetical protein